MTNEEFRKFFEGFGSVMDSIVLVDRSSGRSRGFGFVTFNEVATARKVLASGQPGGVCLDGVKSGRLEMMGKMIEVKVAQPKESGRRNGRADKEQWNSNLMNHTFESPSHGLTSYEPSIHHPIPGPYFSGYVSPVLYYVPPGPFPPPEISGPALPVVPNPTMMIHPYYVPVGQGILPEFQGNAAVVQMDIDNEEGG